MQQLRERTSPMRSIRWSPDLGPDFFFPNRSLASIFGCITEKCDWTELIFPFAARKFTVVHVQHSNWPCRGWTVALRLSIHRLRGIDASDAILPSLKRSTPFMVSKVL